MQRCINTLKMADVHGKITLQLLIPMLDWKHSKSLLGLEKPFESECSSDSDPTE